MKNLIHLAPIALLAITLMSPLGAHAEVTAVNGRCTTWPAAKWTNNLPGPLDTVFLNDNTELTIGADTNALAQGLRIGNTISTTTRLFLRDGTLGATYLVLGDAANSNAEFSQSGGVLTLEKTKSLGFEIGNPAYSPTEMCYSHVIINGGVSNLANLRFNLRPLRETKLSIAGSKTRIRAAAIKAAVGDTVEWTPAILNFTFDADGIAPIMLTGNLTLGEGNHFDLQVDGSAYKGALKRFVLIDAAATTGRFHNINITGLPRGTKVSVEKEGIVLTRP